MDSRENHGKSIENTWVFNIDSRGLPVDVPFLTKIQQLMLQVTPISIKAVTSPGALNQFNHRLGSENCPAMGPTQWDLKMGKIYGDFLNQYWFQRPKIWIEPSKT